MSGVPRRQTPRRPAADEYPEQRPPPSPGAESERKRRVGGDGEVVRIISGIIWEVLTGGVVIGYGGVFSVLLVSLLSCIFM